MATKNQYNDYMRMFAEFKPASAIDQGQWLSMCRRNAEAFTAAGTVMTDSVQLVSRRQAEMFRTNMERCIQATKEMMSGGSPELNTTKQAELAKSMFEQSLSNMREVSELITKSSFEAFDVINRRTAESMDEISNLKRSA